MRDKHMKKRRESQKEKEEMTNIRNGRKCKRREREGEFVFFFFLHFFLRFTKIGS